MSRRTSSGSRFQPLEADDEGSASDSSVYSMRLSKDFYPQNAPIPGMSPIGKGKSRRSTRSSSDSQSPGEMELSQEHYPATVPTELSRQEELALQLPQDLTSGSGAGPSGLQSSAPQPSRGSSEGFSSFERKFKKLSPRSMRPRTPTPEDTSGLHFVSDHYRRESMRFDEKGVDALENMFSLSSESEPAETSANIEKDVEILRGVGFNIDYPNGRLGEGFYGVVYRGTYGMGQPGPTNQFAVKVIEFSNRYADDTNERREKFETEKYILTNAFNRNVVSIRMIINMGEIKSFPFRKKPQEKFLSPERVYLIMDHANLGDFEGWFNANKKTIDAMQRISFIRDLFAGMIYLHTENIIHGDVHAGNVLLFGDQWGIVAKWTDFGLGYVGSDRQYRFHKTETYDMNRLFRLDIAGMHGVFWAILRDRHLGKKETENDKRMIEEILKLLRHIKQDTVCSLEEVYHQFKDILEEELNFDDNYF